MTHTRGKLLCARNWQDGLVAITDAHLMASSPNPLKAGLFKEKLAVKDGYLDIPNKPGLGVELKEGLVEQYPPIPGPWRTFPPGEVMWGAGVEGLDEAVEARRCKAVGA